MAKKPQTQTQEPPTPQHKATFSTDNRNIGQYLIRVEGPHADAFEGRTVPVTRKNGSVSQEKLLRPIWSGTDKESGKPVCLYKFESKPRDDDELDDEIPF